MVCQVDRVLSFADLLPASVLEQRCRRGGFQGVL